MRSKPRSNREFGSRPRRTYGEGTAARRWTNDYRREFRIHTELDMKSVEAYLKMKSLTTVGTLALATLGCSVLPEPIYQNQVASFGTMDKENEGILGDAEACASRLNAHRRAARNANSAKALFAGLGGLASGTGGVIAGVTDEKDAKNAAAITAAVGGGVVLIGTFVTNLLADPTDRLTRHGQGLSSWEVASRASTQFKNLNDWSLVQEPIDMKLAQWQLDTSKYGECVLDPEKPVIGDWWDAGTTGPAGNKHECSELKFYMVQGKTLTGVNPDNPASDNYGQCIVRLSCDNRRSERERVVALTRQGLGLCVKDQSFAVTPGDQRSTEVQ